jgi:aminoglycoside phosphotransferase (APT) family kinase protein
VERNQSPELHEVLSQLALPGDVSEAVRMASTDATVWRVSTDGRTVAVRALRSEQAHAVRAEIAALRLCRESGIPVPEVFASSTDDSRRPAMVTSWLPGDLVGELLVRQPRLARRLGHSSGVLLARIHQIRVPAEIPELHRPWIGLGAESDHELRDRLETIAAPTPSLLHLDYHPYNLLAIGGRVSGVIDWINVCAGDTRADVARAICILRLVCPTILGGRGARRMSLGLYQRAFLGAYQQLNGPLNDMAPFYAWAGRMLLNDLRPKLDLLPITDPGALLVRMERWVEHWRAESALLRARDHRAAQEPASERHHR